MLLPASILRACFHLDTTDSRVEDNVRILTAELDLEGIDGYIVSHLGRMLDATQKSPSLSEFRAWLSREELRGEAKGSAAFARLEGVETEEFLHGTAFRYALDQFKEDLLRAGINSALLETSTILTTGVQTQVKGKNGRWEPQTIQGPDMALETLQTRLGAIQRQVRSGAVEGEMRADVDRWKREMSRRLQQGAGVMLGIQAFDDVHRGIKPGQIAFVLGYTGHLKSTFCLNVVYRAAVYQKRNCGVISLEMAAHEVETAILLMHCGHPKFEDAQKRHKINADVLRTGRVNEGQQKFFERVMQDFMTCEDYGRVFYKEPQSSITVADIQRWAERLHREHTLDLLMIDYLGLVDVGRENMGMETSSSMNKVVRQAKLMANGFANGKGIPILSPFQSNRDGYKDAEKNGGRYRLTAMFMAPEAEKSADLVYYTYLDDGLQSAHEVVLGNLKSRDSAVVTQQVRAFADPDTRIIADLMESGAASANDALEGMDL